MVTGDNNSEVCLLLSLLSLGDNSSSNINSDDNTAISTKGTEWDDVSEEILDDTFDKCLESNIFTVQVYDMDKYVMNLLQADGNLPTLSIQSQLNVLCFINYRARANKRTAKIEPPDLEKAQRMMG